jgi:hypothetical protein
MNNKFQFSLIKIYKKSLIHIIIFKDIKNNLFSLLFMIKNLKKKI